ncbi:MAG: hypothetical protein WCV80_03740 [Candidatus Paceibacterota bacterium]|jgi:hypothetical protein
MQISTKESIKRLGKLVAIGTILEEKGWDRVWGEAEKTAGIKIQGALKMDIFIAELYVAGLPLLKFLSNKKLLNLMPLFNESVIDTLKEEGHFKTDEENGLLNVLAKDRWSIYQSMAKSSAADGYLNSRPLNLFLATAKGIASTYDASPYLEKCIASGLLAIFIFSDGLIEST